MKDLLLRGLSPIYYGLQSIRNQMYDKGILETISLETPVVSVGNLSFGGTGKTPFVRWLCTRDKLADLRIAVISKPYKADFSGGIHKIEGDKLFQPERFGDEACMLANSLKNLSVFVGSSKSEVAQHVDSAEDFDLIVIDDGFQHRRLERSLNIVLLDDSAGEAEYQKFPKGNLREPVDSLSRADWCVFTKSKDAIASLGPMFTEHTKNALKTLVMGFEISKPTRVTPSGAVEIVESLDGGYVVVTGVGKPSQVAQSFSEKFGEHKGLLAFDDHHKFTEIDLLKIADFQTERAAKYIICTEKDYYKIRNRMKNASNLYFVPQDFFCYANEESLIEDIRSLSSKSI